MIAIVYFIVAIVFLFYLSSHAASANAQCHMPASRAFLNPIVRQPIHQINLDFERKARNLLNPPPSSAVIGPRCMRFMNPRRKVWKASLAEASGAVVSIGVASPPHAYHPPWQPYFHIGGISSPSSVAVGQRMMVMMARARSKSACSHPSPRGPERRGPGPP